jgi:hypothetical protein
MKLLLVLSFFIQSDLFAQSEHIAIKKERPTSYYCNIAGVSFGDINYKLIWNELKVNGSKELIVSGFNLQYGQMERKIEGSLIPEAICNEIIQCCSFNGLIFITNITAKYPDGKIIVVNPLSLTLIRNG